MHTHYVLQYAYKLIYIQRIINRIFYKTEILIIYLKCHIETCVVSYLWGSYQQIPTWEPVDMMRSGQHWETSIKSSAFPKDHSVDMVDLGTVNIVKANFHPHTER